MWTEFCNKPEDVEYQLFTRLAALAEVAWTQPWHKNWRSFLVAMDKFNEHLSAKGIVFACSMYLSLIHIYNRLCKSHRGSDFGNGGKQFAE